MISEHIPSIVAMLVCIILSAYFSVTETAFSSLNKTRLKVLTEKGDKKAQLAFDLSVSGLETLQQDFVEALEKIMPDCKREGIYLHPGPKAIAFAAEHDEDLRGCHNTDAHLRSQLIGRSETVAVLDGAPDLGSFGNVFLIDFDMTRARKRKLRLTVIGE